MEEYMRRWRKGGREGGGGDGRVYEEMEKGRNRRWETGKMTRQ